MGEEDKMRKETHNRSIEWDKGGFSRSKRLITYSALLGKTRGLRVALMT